MKKDRLDKVLKFIDTYFCEKITLDDLAQITNSDKFNLSKEFKKEFGKTPHAYIMSKRLSYAKELMKEESSFALIAQICGFSDQSHLIKQFKKEFGYTPTKTQAS